MERTIPVAQFGHGYLQCPPIRLFVRLGTFVVDYAHACGGKGRGRKEWAARVWRRNDQKLVNRMDVEVKHWQSGDEELE